MNGKPRELIALKEFLFRKKFPPAQKPFFTHQVRLAEVICSDEKNIWYEKSPDSVETYISMFLSGGLHISHEACDAIKHALVFAGNQRNLNTTTLTDEFEHLVSTWNEKWEPWVSGKNKLKMFNPKVVLESSDLEFIHSKVEKAGRITLGTFMQLIKQRKRTATGI